MRTQNAAEPEGNRYRVVFVIYLAMLKPLSAFPCGLCICTNTRDDPKYAMYCMGDKIMDNFTSTINPNVMFKIYTLNLIDTSVKTLSTNFENWTKLESINLSGNINLNCSTFHDMTWNFVIVRGQCEYVITTFKTVTLSNNSVTCQYKYCVTVIIAYILLLLYLL